MNVFILVGTLIKKTNCKASQLMKGCKLMVIMKNILNRLKVNKDKKKEKQRTKSIFTN